MGGYRDGCEALRGRGQGAHRGEHPDRTRRRPEGHRGPDRVPLFGSRAPHHRRDSERQRRQRPRRMIVLVFTGGTISMRHDPAAGGAVPALAGKDILEMVPQLRSIPRLEIDEFGTFPGPHMTAERMWELRERVESHIARADVEGVVITHGTDSLEESAYLVARSLASV